MSKSIFDLTGKVAVVTGGYGVLGGMMSAGLAAAGAKVAVFGRRRDAGEEKAAELRAAGGEAMALEADVLEMDQLRAARDELLARWGQVDILINAAGGNVQRARSDVRPIFEVPLDALDEVVTLNLHGTVLPTMVFGEVMAAKGKGSVVNISSMAAQRALSGVMGYSLGKAAIDGFTRWMAVEMATKYGDGVRVNAIAPGFFVAEQNRGLLLKDDGSLTDRAQTIIARTPMGRFGVPAELVGAVHWLSSDASAFVTGAVIPIDGGFSAWSGV
ncbi:MAG: SDR family oxidoreductase [Gemmatimonadaceae bacterium]|nr:SDR family oxidoreductase [Gemmatimonadaceae bacterium]